MLETANINTGMAIKMNQFKSCPTSDELFFFSAGTAKVSLAIQ
jgi:hypothetical protein